MMGSCQVYPYFIAQSYTCRTIKNVNTRIAASKQVLQSKLSEMFRSQQLAVIVALCILGSFTAAKTPDSLNNKNKKVS